MTRFLPAIIFLLVTFTVSAETTSGYIVYGVNLSTSTSLLRQSLPNESACNGYTAVTLAGIYEVCSAVFPSQTTIDSSGFTYTFTNPTPLPDHILYDSHATDGDANYYGTGKLYLLTSAETVCIDTGLPPVNGECPSANPCESLQGQMQTIWYPVKSGLAPFGSVGGCAVWPTYGSNECYVFPDGEVYCIAVYEYDGQEASETNELVTQLPPDSTTNTTQNYSDSQTDSLTYDDNGTTVTETTTTETTRLSEGTRIESNDDGSVTIHEYGEGWHKEITTHQELRELPDGSTVEITTTTTTVSTDDYTSVDVSTSYDQSSGPTVATTPGRQESTTSVKTETTSPTGEVTRTEAVTGDIPSPPSDSKLENPELTTGDCGVLPDAVCGWLKSMSDFFDSDTGELPSSDVPTVDYTMTDVPDYDSGLPSTAQCPAPFVVVFGMFGTHNISLQPFCNVAEMLRPYLIAMSYFLSIFIVLGIRR